MGFNFLFDKIEPTGFGLNSMALCRSDENDREEVIVSLKLYLSFKETLFYGI